jgi:hypothetical protein
VVRNYIHAWHFPNEHKSLIVGHLTGVTGFIMSLAGWHSVSVWLHGGGMALVLHHHFTNPATRKHVEGDTLDDVIDAEA